MTRRVTLQGRDWATPAPSMPTARRMHIHGPIQPMSDDTPASLSRWFLVGIAGGAVLLVAMFS